MLNQDILFDIGARPFDWKSLLSSFGLFLLGLSLVVMRKKKIGVFLIKNIGYIMGCVSVLVMAYMLTSWFSKKREGSEALQKGNFSLVEGKVNNFKPMPYEGHAEESFTLERERFSYSDYVYTPCFNHSSAHGGPIRADLHIRVSYIDGCILKIERLE